MENKIKIKKKSFRNANVNNLCGLSEIEMFRLNNTTTTTTPYNTKSFKLKLLFTLCA